MNDTLLEVERQRVIIDELWGCLNACLAHIDLVDPLSDASMDLLRLVANKTNYVALLSVAPPVVGRA